MHPIPPLFPGKVAPWSPSQVLPVEKAFSFSGAWDVCLPLPGYSFHFIHSLSFFSLPPEEGAPQSAPSLDLITLTGVRSPHPPLLSGSPSSNEIPPSSLGTESLFPLPFWQRNSRISASFPFFTRGPSTSFRDFGKVRCRNYSPPTGELFLPYLSLPPLRYSLNCPASPLFSFTVPFEGAPACRATRIT